MGKGAKLISFPLLPQAWQMRKSTWPSSSRARARTSPSPPVLPRSRCQLSLLTPWCTVSATVKSTCSQLLSAVAPAEISQISVWHRGFQFSWWHISCPNRTPNVTLNALCGCWCLWQDHVTQGKWDTNDHCLQTNVIHTSPWHLLTWRWIVNAD